LPDLLDTLYLRLLWRQDILLRISVVCIINTHEIATLVYVVCTAEHGVHLFQHDALCLRDEEVDKDRKQDVDTSEHVEGIEATFLRDKLGLPRRWKGMANWTYCEEGWEELVHNEVGDVLRLRSHSDCLRADVHGEHFGRPDPDGGAPRRFVEEDEEEEQEHDRDGDGVRFGSSSKSRSLRLYRCNNQHAEGHTDATNDKEEATAEAVDSPSCVEREQDSEGGVESVDQCNSGRALEDFLVNLGRITVERALTSDLLAGVDDERKTETFAHGTILPEGRVR
jgi:hypothetical protein